MPKQSATGQGDKRAKYAGAQANKQRRHKTQEHPSQADHPEAPPSKRRRTRRPTITLQQKTAPDGISRPSSADSPSQPHPPAHPFANGPVIKTSLRGRHSHKGTLELPTREHVISQTPDQRQDAGEEGEKRVLRSQAGISRSHSELALFFTDYEEVVFGPEKAPGLSFYTRWTATHVDRIILRPSDCRLCALSYRRQNRCNLNLTHPQPRWKLRPIFYEFACEREIPSRKQRPAPGIPNDGGDFGHVPIRHRDS